jgi:hypothetical protein
VLIDSLERRLGAERLDRDIDTTPVSEPKDLVDGVDPAEIDRVGAAVCRLLVQ